MNNRVKKLFFALFIAIFCNQKTFAAKIISGTRELPLEVNLMVEDLQEQSPANFTKILPTIMNIDLYARSMSKEDIFLLGKIEIYKTLLKNYDTPIKQPVDGGTIATLRTAIAKIPENNFMKWFLQALLRDSLELTGNPQYKEFLLQKSTNQKIEKIEYRKLEKKGELIQFWASKIAPEAQDFPESFMTDLTPKMFAALKNIESSFELMAKQATLIPLGTPLKDQSELKFFAVKEVAPKKTGPTEEQGKSVEQILAPITDTVIKPEDLPKPSQENWLEDENTPASLQNLPKPNNDADWLQDF